ncbi:ROK family protein [Rathayibacter soli]|uniref:ROK family protein n=1 Tax=Rathayibacter soli TaxID=3144168 RepID=UPI0027E479EF|nr:ROK family protein [Glaciibacter superstes]
MTRPLDGTAPVIALDVGGTAMKGAVVEHSGVPTREYRWSTPRRDGPDAVVDAVLRAIDELVAATPSAAAVGLVVPGVVDDAAGVAVYSENILWHDVSFRDAIASRTGLPTAVGHDVRAGGAAEWLLGAGHQADDGLFLPIGTGISGALRVQGRFITHPLAGEIGHIDVGADESCACGARGCLESIASAAAIARRYERASGSTAINGAKGVCERMQAGDRIAQRVWAEAVSALVRALTIYISLLAPTIVVIGGGLSKAGDALFDPLRKRLADALIWQEQPMIARSTLGDNSGCIGAGILALDLIGIQPATPIQDDQ